MYTINAINNINALTNTVLAQLVQSRFPTLEITWAAEVTTASIVTAAGKMNLVELGELELDDDIELCLVQVADKDSGKKLHVMLEFGGDLIVCVGCNEMYVPMTDLVQGETVGSIMEFISDSLHEEFA